MRLDSERQFELEPKRTGYAIQKLREANKEIVEVDDKKIIFIHKDKKVQLFPYSGWFTGKTVVDGRGIKKLLKQL